MIDGSSRQAIDLDSQSIEIENLISPVDDLYNAFERNPQAGAISNFIQQPRPQCT
jgi:hypothetical protein